MSEYSAIPQMEKSIIAAVDYAQERPYTGSALPRKGMARAALKQYIEEGRYPEQGIGLTIEGRLRPSELDKLNIRHTAERSTYVVTTADGRPIVVERAGSENGDLLISLHGMPGDRRLSFPKGSETMDCVTYDRPGYGLSEPWPGRKPTDSLDAITTLCIRFGAIYSNKNAYLLGASGGCPHALACAAASPFIKKTVVAAPTAPYEALGEAWFDGMHPFNKGVFRLAREIMHEEDSLGLDEIVDRYVAQIQRDPHIFFNRELRGAPGVAINNHQKLQEALRYSAQGWKDDIMGMLDWGFRPQDIKSEVLVVYGGKDVFSPPHHAEWLASNIPNATSIFLPHATHDEVVLRGKELGAKWLNEQSGG